MVEITPLSPNRQASPDEISLRPMALENPAEEEDSLTEECDQAKPSSCAGMPLTGLERTGAPILGHPDLPIWPSLKLLRQSLPTCSRTKHPQRGLGSLGKTQKEGGINS